ncbi:uncharacterized protein LOC111086587 [Limulus polyphemus]|uniref:Uncharacterized protein LOC111086587 n=1 Tax=Limulus polyphemus TaxID=6850 RepID=A0ABM1SPX4_LIMPO|nr:uncharacterized protein LOC111086587 [Limulus polyphemus]
MTRCSWGTPEKLFHDVVNGSRQVIQELCLPGPMQEGYLKYAECFKKVSLHENKCAPKYRTLTELFQKQLHDTDEDVNKGRREWCCSYSDFINCQYTHVTHECGTKAGVFLRSHTDRMSSPLIHEHCPLYIYGSEACISNAVAGCVNIWNIFLMLNSLYYVCINPRAV